MHKPIRGATALLIVFGAGWLLNALCLKPYRGNRRARTLLARTQHAYDAPASPQRATAARANSEQAIRSLSGSLVDQGLWMLAGANERLVGRYTQAAAAYRNASAWGERPEIDLNLAVSEMGSGATAEAVEHMVRAARFDTSVLIGVDSAPLQEMTLKRLRAQLSRPQLADFYLTLGIAWLAESQSDEAGRIIVQAALLDPTVLTRPQLMNWGDAILRVALDGLARAKAKNGEVPLPVHQKHV